MSDTLNELALNSSQGSRLSHSLHQFLRKPQELGWVAEWCGVHMDNSGALHWAKGWALGGGFSGVLTRFRVVDAMQKNRLKHGAERPKNQKKSLHHSVETTVLHTQWCYRITATKCFTKMWTRCGLSIPRPTPRLSCWLAQAPGAVPRSFTSWAQPS